MRAANLKKYAAQRVTPGETLLPAASSGSKSCRYYILEG